MSTNSLNKKSLKDIQKNLKDLVSDLEVGNLHFEESKKSADSSSQYYSSKYYNGYSGKNCERKVTDFGPNNANIDSAVIKFNRRSSGYGTIGR